MSEKLDLVSSYYPPTPPPQYGPPPPPQYGPPPQYPPTMPSPMAPMGPKPPSAMPLAAGIMLVIVAILGFVLWGSVIAAGAAAAGFIPGMGEALATVGAIFLIFSILALLGAVYCFTRKSFAIAIIGAIFGILSVGYCLGSILSIVALILIIIAKDEFGAARPAPTSGPPGYVPPPTAPYQPPPPQYGAPPQYQPPPRPPGY